MAVAMIGPKFYAWDRNGKPLAFGKLYTYQARTNTPKPTYQSEDQVVENTNPVILNGEGYADVYLSGSYKMVLKDDKDNEIWSSDPVSANEVTEWKSCLSATYLSPTSFKVAGNFVDTYKPGSKIRIDNNTSEFSYSTILTSTFAASETTITITDPVVTTGVVEVCVSVVSQESMPEDSPVNIEALKALNLQQGQSVVTKGYYSSGDGAHATYIIKTQSQAASDGDVIDGYGNHLLSNGNVAVLKISNLINAEQFGANDQDSTNALKAAAALCDGHDFTFGINSRKLAVDELVFAKKVNIIGGLLKNSPASGNANKPAIWLQASESNIGESGHVDIEGEDIAGTYPVLAFGNSGVRVGPVTPDANTFLHGINIGDNLKISKMKGEGILAYHLKDSNIGNPEIKSCAYAGILGKSLIDCSIDSPKIQDIVKEGGVAGDNAYGITLTRDTVADKTNFPPCTNVQLGKPIIKNVPTWIGLDTHAGVNIDVTWARVYQCLIPFNIQYDSATAGLQNRCQNVTFRGYGSSFVGENDSREGLTCLGLSAQRNRDITLDLILENCGDSSGSERGAVNITEVEGLRGQVKVVNAKRNAFSQNGVNTDVDLKLDIEGVSWSGGSSFYARLDPPNCSNFKLSGDWGERIGAGNQADIGIFYSAAQGSYEDVLIDAKMDVPSGVYLSDGTNNKWEDITWVTKEQRMFSRITLAGGSPSEVFPVDFPKNFRGNWNNTVDRNDITTMVTIDSTAHPLLTARTSGILDQNTVNVTLSTLDGSNIQGGGFAVSFTTSVDGIVFGD